MAFASRSLSLTEQHYAQIEKECFTIVFACKCFNQYIHGRENTTIHTDHKPMVAIFNKPIHSAPKRLQQMILRLQKYHLTLQYCPGSKMYIAEMLSRAYITDHKEKEEKDYDVFRLEHVEQFFKILSLLNKHSTYTHEKPHRHSTDQKGHSRGSHNANTGRSGTERLPRDIQ